MKKKLTTRIDDLIEQGKVKNLIRISDEGKRIEYLQHGISRDWTKPEAIVEARSYLALVLQYGYPDDRIRLFAPVTVGSSLREADIEVFSDAFDEFDKLIFCKIWDERKEDRDDGDPYAFQIIAEDIGFDATGKPTKVNELDEIGAELAKFINTAAEEEAGR